MKSRALRFALATLFVAVLGGAAYITWIEESAARGVAEASRRFDARTQLMSRTLLDIKSAQPGYVAAGQGDEFWSAKVDALLPPAREGLADLRAQAQGAEAQTAVDAALAALEDFEQMDRRAREYAHSGQRLLASDLVFSDGIEKIDAAVGALVQAREAQIAAHDRAVREHRRTQVKALGGAAAAALVTLLLLTPVPLPRASSTETSVVRAEPAAERRVASPARAIAPLPAAPAGAGGGTTKAAPGPPSQDLAGIASLCSDLARVVDTRALPGALARAAGLLQASGIVVWVADPDGRELIPVASHGYPPHLVTRLGTINRDAENVTAAAFRTGLLQTVKSDAISPGAIAAPLPTPSGPVGVISAEVLHDRERDEPTLATATIVAAQLATLMAPPVRSPKAEVAG